MKTKTRIAATVASLSFMLFSFNHCVMDQKTNTKPNTGTTTNVDSNPVNNPGPAPTPIVVVTPTPTPAPTPGVQPPPVVVQQAEIDVGIKNFEQINDTMSVLTGVSKMDNDIRNTFSDLEVQLPTDNSVKSFLAANQVAITKLAAEYCDALVDSGNLRGAVWPGFNFNGTPNQVLTNNTQKIGVIDQTLNRFWGVNVGGDRSTSQLEMLSLTNDLLMGENLGNSGTTRTTVKGLCTAALSSAQVVLM